MVRMLESEEVLAKSGADVSIETQKDSAVPTDEEMWTIVHGPRPPIRWMRWLGAAVLVVATALVVTYATSDDEADLVRYQTPTSAEAGTEMLTMSAYLPPESSGQVYNYNPVPEVVPMLTIESYLPPESSGQVYNYNPAPES